MKMKIALLECHHIIDNMNDEEFLTTCNVSTGFEPQSSSHELEDLAIYSTLQECLNNNLMNCLKPILKYRLFVYFSICQGTQ